MSHTDLASAADAALIRAQELEPATELHPTMQALTVKQRAFVEALFNQKPGWGSYAAAARAAGYGNREGTTSADSFARIANRLLNTDTVIAAIATMAKKRVRSEAPAAVHAVREIVNDPLHKDRLKAAVMVLDRIDPQETKHSHSVEVTHKVDHDGEAVAQLRMLKSLGVARDRLEEVFGFTGLSRYERLLASADEKAAATPAPIVDAEFTVVEPKAEPFDPSAGLEDLLGPATSERVQ